MTKLFARAIVRSIAEVTMIAEGKPMHRDDSRVLGFTNGGTSDQLIVI